MTQRLRVGIGVDVHAFAPGRRLILGGVEIPFEKGLLGHSDADVLTHAICDALLGAAGEPDIGVLFPPGAAETKDVSSLALLRDVVARVEGKGYAIVNIDAVVLAEAPAVAPHAEAMKRALDGALKIGTDRIGIKATTTEGLGYTGRGEGIAAHSVALIESRP